MSELLLPDKSNLKLPPSNPPELPLLELLPPQLKEVTPAPERWIQSASSSSSSAGDGGVRTKGEEPLKSSKHVASPQLLLPPTMPPDAKPTFTIPINKDEALVNEAKVTIPRTNINPEDHLFLDTRDKDAQLPFPPIVKQKLPGTTRAGPQARKQQSRVPKNVAPKKLNWKAAFVQSTPSDNERIEIANTLRTALIRMGYRGSTLETLYKSLFLSNLWSFHFECSAAKCNQHGPQLLLSLSEIEEGLFWDETLTHFATRRLSRLQKEDPDISESTLQFMNIHSIPAEVGYRSRLTIWMTVLTRLIDRAVLAAEELRDMSQKITSLINPDILDQQRTVIAFHQTVLWTSRVIRLSSYFSLSASAFATNIIENWLFSKPGQHLDQSTMTSGIFDISRYQATALPFDHPLAALRLFTNDKVFVSSNPHSVPGGGFIGVLVLGSSTVDIEQACKIYGRELQAQKWIASAIIRLKLKYARNVRQIEAKEKVESKRNLSFKERFSVSKWLSLPLTFLTPSLMTIVDYMGFRMAVYPLFYRSPMAVERKSLCIGSRLLQEMKTLECYLKLPVSNRHNSEGFDLLQLENENPAMVILHRVHRLLLLESGMFLDPSIHGAMTAHLRLPELGIATELAALSTQSIKRRSDLPDQQLQLPKRRELESSTYPSIESLIGDPFGIASFERLKAGRNQLIVPAPSLAELRDAEAVDDILTTGYLTRFLRTVAIPGVLRGLESQPFFSPYDSASLRRYLHGAGLNCRHLGVLLNTTRHTWLREFLVVDIVARTLKHILLDCIRGTLFLNDYKDPPYLDRKESILSGIPLPPNIAVCLFDESVLQLIPPFLQGAARVQHREDQWIDFLALNLLRITFLSNATSTLMWKDVIGPQASRRFHCNEVLIRQSACPPAALYEAFIALSRHPTEAGVKITAEPLNLLDINDVTGWSKIVKTSFDHDVLRVSSPLFEFLEEPSLVPLLHRDESQAKLGTQNVWTNPTSSESKENLSSRDSSSGSCHSDKLSITNGGTRTGKDPTQKNASVAQRFVARNVMISLVGAGSLLYLSQRDLLHAVRAEMLNRKFVSQNATEDSGGRQPDVRDGERNMLTLLQLFSAEMSTELWSLTVVHSQVTLMSRSSALEEAMLELASWAMEHNQWELAKYFALESLSLHPESSLLSVQARWYLMWSEVHESVSSSSAKHILDHSSLHRKFKVTLDLISAHWEQQHPMFADTLLAFAWCCYLIQDKIRCEDLIRAAIKHSIKISSDRNDNGLQIIDTVNLPTFPRQIFDPFSEKIIDKIPPPLAGSKLGHMFRMLGSVCLARAATLSLTAPVQTAEEIRMELRKLDTDSGLQSAMFTSRPTDSAQPGVQKEIVGLCNNAAEAFSTAVRIFKCRATTQRRNLLLAAAKYEWVSALMLRLQHFPEDYGGLIISQCLELSIKSFETRCRYLPPRHVEIMASSLQLAILLERHERYKQSLKLWEQLHRDYAYTKSKHERLVKQSLGGGASSRAEEWELVRYITQSYRPNNLLSLFLWMLPNVHFLGIHDQHMDDDGCSLPITDAVLAKASVCDMIPSSRDIKATLISVYLNSCLSAAQLSRLLRLFQRLKFIERFLLSRDLRHLEASRILAYTGGDTFTGLAPSFLEPSVYSGSEDGVIVEFLSCYPRLLTKEQLLVALSESSQTKKMLAQRSPRSPRSPRIAIVPPGQLVRLNVPVIEVPSMASRLELLGLDNTEEFVTNLITCCESDVCSFQEEISSEAFAVFGLLPKNGSYDEQQPSFQINTPRMGDTDFLSKENVKHRVILEALEFKSPLEVHNFKSEPLDLLCSILYWFLDLKAFKELCTKTRSSVREAEAEDALGLSMLAAGVRTEVKYADSSRWRSDENDGDEIYEEGKLHYFQNYEQILHDLGAGR